MSGRLPVLPALAAMGVLLTASIGLQLQRDRAFATDLPARQILYVQSPEVMKRLMLSYDVIGADVYWIRALQHFGGSRYLPAKERQYELLFPLLDMATSLDPYFNIAYRFGAIFLSEPQPAGPGPRERGRFLAPFPRSGRSELSVSRGSSRCVPGISS